MTYNYHFAVQDLDSNIILGIISNINCDIGRVSDESFVGVAEESVTSKLGAILEDSLDLNLSGCVLQCYNLESGKTDEYQGVVTSKLISDIVYGDVYQIDVIPKDDNVLEASLNITTVYMY